MSAGSGELNCSAKLTEYDVVQILKMNRRFRQAMEIAKANSFNAIAERFGVSRNHVYRITSRQKWKHVTIDMGDRMENVIYTTDKAPDITGEHGKAWIQMKEFDDRPDVQATLQSWIVQAAYAHPFWSHYQVTVIHLRDIDGVNPAKKVFHEATHEILLMALNPDKPYPLNDAPSYLMPINYAGQWIADNDAEAVKKAEECVHRIINGTLSPDTDFRSQWDSMFTSK